MDTSIYFQPRTTIQQAYYDFRLASKPEASCFPFVNTEGLEYMARYVLMNECHRRLHPFQFVSPGDRVVQVGFDRVYFTRGMSFPLILSALVGDQGIVLAIDPDQRNTRQLMSFVERNGVTNVRVAERAAWKDRADIEMSFASDWSPNSVASDVAQRYGIVAATTKSTTATIVQATTLDDIVREHCPDKEIDYLSLTVNGAEEEVLAGASDILRSAKNLKIGMALSFTHFSYQPRKRVCSSLAEHGFRIAVADAPHDPWRAEPFLFACAVKKSEEELGSMGFQKTTWQAVERSAGESLSRLMERAPETKPSGALSNRWRRVAGQYIDKVRAKLIPTAASQAGNTMRKRTLG